MGLIDRVGRLFRANANAAVDKLENPSAMLEQAVREMEEAILISRQAVAKAMAVHKRNEELHNKSSQEKDNWQKRAKLALTNGQEDLAREALANAQEYSTNATMAQQTMLASAKQVENVKAKLKQQEAALQKARTEKETLLAKFQLAQSSKEINALLDTSSSTSAASAFEKMRGQVMELEAESEIYDEIAGNTSDNRFAQLEAASETDDAFASLKAEMEREQQALILEAQLEEQRVLQAQIEQQFAQLPPASSPAPKVESNTLDDLLNSDFFK